MIFFLELAQCLSVLTVTIIIPKTQKIGRNDDFDKRIYIPKIGKIHIVKLIANYNLKLIAEIFITIIMTKKCLF